MEIYGVVEKEAFCPYRELSVFIDAESANRAFEKAKRADEAFLYKMRPDESGEFVFSKMLRHAEYGEEV